MKDLSKIKEGTLITITQPINKNFGMSFTWNAEYDYSYVGKCFEFLECINGMIHIRLKGNDKIIRLYKHKYQDKIELYKNPKY